MSNNFETSDAYISESVFNSPPDQEIVFDFLSSNPHTDIYNLNGDLGERMVYQDVWIDELDKERDFEIYDTNFRNDQANLANNETKDLRFDFEYERFARQNEPSSEVYNKLDVDTPLTNKMVDAKNLVKVFTTEEKQINTESIEQCSNAACLESKLDELLMIKPCTELKNRKDVVNKGNLRFIRNCFRHLFLAMYDHKRMRTNYKKAKQFECLLIKFISEINRASTPLVQDDEFWISFELIGRIINNKLFKCLPQAYNSILSLDIKQLLEDFDKCCVGYSHRSYRKLVQSNLFQKLLAIFEQIQEQGLFQEYNIAEATQSKFLNNMFGLDRVQR